MIYPNCADPMSPDVAKSAMPLVKKYNSSCCAIRFATCMNDKGPSELKQYLTAIVLADKCLPNSFAWSHSVTGVLLEDFMAWRWRKWIVDPTKLGQLRMPTIATLMELLETQQKKIFQYSNTPFDTNGVLYWIGTEGGTKPYTNPHTSGEVKASTTSDVYVTLSCFVQHQHDGQQIFTDNEPGTWMSVDLGEGRSLVPNYYCLRNGSINSSYNGSMRNWWLQGSNDGKHWDTLRSHTNDTSLKDQSFSVAAWPVLQDTSAAYRHFRILQTGKNASGQNDLTCSGIELYGALQQ